MQVCRRKIITFILDIGTVEKTFMGKNENTIFHACTLSGEWKNGKRCIINVRI